MGEEFSDLLSHISGQSVNKQVQELAMILTRTLEIVINAVDMLEQNFNNLSNSVNQRISALEQKINMIGVGEAKPQVTPVIQTASVVSKRPVVLDEHVEEVSPPEDAVYTPPPVSQPVRIQPSTPPSAPPIQAPPPPPPAAKPINPINVRQALNTELKQLFTKMRAQTE
ncbi:MAG: hypothetical protein OdinLCB4_005915 [Candidatus Odinarchaeum yellowstonii]|uniref:Uncharacterized protein n=1 Tax=Odinarchaeota yellowstonii (strain LCB_4) TaxID=1841599 RepID=A0AAF0D1I9_ODILC|nr:MAG: hypothetical protein OdinLCB4_005915 [Candidatus Odinarchaeum yellowstonii]